MKQEGLKLSELSKNYYMQGYNCAESVFHAIKDANIIELSDDILKISTGFRAGVAGMGCICGVLSSAVMLLSLKYGRKNNNESTKVLHDKIKLFYEIFISKYKSTCCRVITRKFKENFDSTERRQFCAGIVSDMIEELAKIL
jgi:C_GCAxxG_C_C family probable redox protein